MDEAAREVVAFDVRGALLGSWVNEGVAITDNEDGAFMDPSGRNWWHADDGLGDHWPYVPAKQYLDWDLTDPAGKGQDEVRAIRDEIERRVGALPL